LGWPAELVRGSEVGHSTISGEGGGATQQQVIFSVHPVNRDGAFQR